MERKLKTMFFGSGEFAVPILEQLLNLELIELSSIVTQKDRPAGRDQRPRSVPVRELMQKFYQQIRVYTPEVYRDEEKRIIETEKPELIIVADYGQILPEFTINYPKYKCLNVHGSLLPDLRGAVPIPLAILEGYEKTGVSIAVMTTGLDDGPVVGSRERTINSDHTTATLKSELAQDGAVLLSEILGDWVCGEIQAVPQEDARATYAPKSLISKERAKFTKDTNLTVLDRMIRAFNPWPVAWCEISFNGKKKRVKVFKGKVYENSSTAMHSEDQFIRDGKKLLAGVKAGMLEIEELQLEGKNKGSGEDYLFLNGSIIL